MPFRGLLVLPSDLQLKSVRDLPASVRARLGHDPDAVVVARPLSRASAKVIDRATAEFLRQFQTPRSVADAVMDFASAQRRDPIDVFDEAYPLLERMHAAGFLVPAGSDAVQPRRATFERGARVAGWTIRALVHMAEEVEVYQVRRRTTWAALKIQRNCAPTGRVVIDREERVLQHLPPAIGPRLFAAGTTHDRRFVLSEWVAGVDAETAAHELRRRSPEQRRIAMAGLCTAVASAYADLHEAGVLHGDVHAKNIRVDREGAVTLIDFGWSVLRDDRSAGAPTGRVGAGFLFEPELARAALSHRPPPRSTAKGEIFLVAALLDALWVGSPYLELKLDWDRALRQIANDSPRTFTDRRAAAEPDLEPILQRALSKRPAARHRSMRVFARAFGRFSARLEPTRSSVTGLTSRRAAGPCDRLLRELALVDGVSRSGVEDPPAMSPLRHAASRPPYASVACGAAGVAYLFYRLAVLRGDPLMLARADVWIEDAVANMARPNAFTDGGELTAEAIGEASLLHAAPGLHLVRALVSRARGDRRTHRESVRAFTRSATTSTERMDVTHGLAGLLLGCAALISSYAPRRPPPWLLSCGRRLRARLWSKLRTEPHIGSPEGRFDLGMAHGWCGCLYALLRWSAALACAPPPPVLGRLSELASCSEPFGRGTRWRWITPHVPGGPVEPYVAGWCNGSAGQVHLWSLAAERTGRRRYHDLAVDAAWQTWENNVEAGPSLCCGFAGRALALATIAKLTDEAAWLQRARWLAREAVLATRDEGSHGTWPDSLFHGKVGIALLLAELEQPATVGLPPLGVG